MPSVRIAIAGLGGVGTETVRLLRAGREGFRRRLGAELEIIAVCDRHAAQKARRLGLPARVLRLTDPRRLAALPGIDIVVELLGGLDAPRRLILTALRSGRHAVTANKHLISHCWEELRTAQRAGDSRLLYEASVAGGIPIINALETSLAADRIEAVYGILNGTTNYILSRMREGMERPEALRQAQALGLAERDPVRDLSGQDTADKVSVLASLVTGAWIRPYLVRSRGIQDIERQDVVFAEEVLGRRVKLLGAARLSGNDRQPELETFVSPTLIPLDHPLASVQDEFNAIMVRAAAAGDLMFYGKGAGPGPAASAVLGDILRLGRALVSGASASPPRPAAAVPRLADSDSAFYLRLAAQDRPGVLCAITSALGRLGISISTIHQPAGDGRTAPVIITTHAANPGTFGRALRDILALGSISRRHTVMRLLS
ncbi:MAG: homoserine dehydrogenase [Elusimicrobiota bacterium]|jgi:homoserine dehydrogenase